MSEDKEKQPSSPENKAEEQKLESPIKPLLWILIPLIAVVVYGLLSN